MSSGAMPSNRGVQDSMVASMMGKRSSGHDNPSLFDRIVCLGLPVKGLGTVDPFDSLNPEKIMATTTGGGLPPLQQPGGQFSALGSLPQVFYEQILDIPAFLEMGKAAAQERAQEHEQELQSRSAEDEQMRSHAMNQDDAEREQRNAREAQERHEMGESIARQQEYERQSREAENRHQVPDDRYGGLSPHGDYFEAEEERKRRRDQSRQEEQIRGKWPTIGK